jgi:hypothetical protein
LARYSLKSGSHPSRTPSEYASAKNRKTQQNIPRASQKRTSRRIPGVDLGLFRSLRTTLKIFKIGLNPKTQTNIKAITIVKSFAPIDFNLPASASSFNRCSNCRSSQQRCPKFICSSEADPNTPSNDWSTVECSSSSSQSYTCAYSASEGPNSNLGIIQRSR